MVAPVYSSLNQPGQNYVVCTQNAAVLSDPARSWFSSACNGNLQRQLTELGVRMPCNDPTRQPGCDLDIVLDCVGAQALQLS